MNPPLNVTLIKEASQLPQVVNFLNSVNEFGIDTETNVVSSFFERKIRTIQIGDKSTQYVIDLLGIAGSSEALTGGQGGYRTSTWAEPLVEALKPYIDSKDYLKVGYNLEFDYQVLKWCLGLRMWNIYDAFQAEKVLYSGKVHFMTTGFWALDDAVARYCGLEISKSEQKGFDMETPLTESQIEYAGLDTRLALAVKSGQTPHIQRLGLAKAVEIENNAVPGVADMHMNGLKIDEPMWLGLVEEVETKHAGHVKDLDNWFCEYVGTKEHSQIDLALLEKRWKETKNKEDRKAARTEFVKARQTVKLIEKNIDTYEGQAAINYGSTPQLKIVLHKMGYKLKSTDDRTLKQITGDALISKLMDYRETQKILSTYGRSFITDHISPFDRRVHSRFRQLGAATGRFSSSNPNVQNIPKGSDWRGCFIADDDAVIITTDYNGAELRIIAELSGEQSWIDAFNNGWDVHSVGAEILFGQRWKDAAEEDCAYYKSHAKCKCKEHMVLRDHIKACNFLIAYGGEAKKLSESLGVTKAEAETLLNTYRSTFKAVTAYLKKSGQDAITTCMSRTLSGRIRFYTKPTWDMAKEAAFEDIKKKFGVEKAQAMTGRDISKMYAMMYGSIEREGKNTPIQGCNADIIKVALGCGFDTSGNGYLWHHLDKYGAKLINCVHDELVVQAPKAHQDEVKHLVEDCMVRAGAEFITKIVMVAEGGISDRWKK